MKLRVNGQEFDFDAPLSLSELLRRLTIKSEAAAVAINSEVIPRSEMGFRLIQSNDEIEIIHPVGGG